MSKKEWVEKSKEELWNNSFIVIAYTITLLRYLICY